MKKILTLLFLLPLFAIAQNKTHTVGPKESLSSIGRLYEVNGRVLANYNNIDYEKGLTIGQVLKIPPKGTTLPAEAKPVEVKPVVVEPVKTVPVKTEPVKQVVTKTEPGGSPIYHKVGKKETLYHISTLYGKVPIDDIKRWNNLTGDGVSEGANLIVGYTRSGTATKPTVKENTVKAKTTNPGPPDINPETFPPVKAPVEKPKEKVSAETRNVAKDFNGGTFKNLFASQSSNGSTVNEEGTAAAFKSTSGWNDGKYYCLHNTALPGTIIKITNKVNGKSVYAKVLDVIPDIKQNAGIVIRLSNAASGELGAAENNFNCSLNYSK
ncbi:MAG TPA: LysM peptidoglycan-binding domain-containing protein [Ferruginibacter sp.]|nr:LysM peptidoglycan-binding domain-containing protein [Ferruginibacter sp.]